MTSSVAYVTTGEVAKRLAVDPATVRRWAIEGRLPAVVTPGGHYRFREADIDAFLAPAARGAAPAASATAG